MIGEDYDIKNMMEQQKKLQIPTEIVKVETDFESNVMHKLNYGGFKIPDFKITGSDFPPEEIMGLVIRNAKGLVKKNISNDAKECVLTVPAHWMGHKRKSFLLSSSTSGFKSNLINSTTAATIGFWTDHAKTKEGAKQLSAMKKGAKTPMFVFYVGGGHYDAAVVNVSANPEGKLYFKTQCVAGGAIGGEDMTSAIMEYVCANKLQREEDPCDDLQGRDRRSTLTNDPNINAFVDTITEHLENLGDIIKESFGKREDNGLGDALTYSSRVTIPPTPMKGGTDPNTPPPAAQQEAAPKQTRKDKYRGTRPSPLKNSVGLFVAEAQRIRAVIDNAKCQLSNPNSAKKEGEN